MAMKHVLLVEDDSNIRSPLSRFLKGENFKVTEADSVSAAEKAISTESPDIVIMDWSLPDGQGVDLLRTWRKRGISVPTILLTARSEVIDKVMGLEGGANDYVTKPFEPRELLARIRVQLRSGAEAPAASAQKLKVLSLEMDLVTREVHWEMKKIDLKKMEFNLLKIFMENPDRVFTREELLTQVWGYENYPSTRTVDTHILQLRQKIQDDLFETLRGVGYRLRKDTKGKNE